MSKCKEAFEAITTEGLRNYSLFEFWQAAWNARGKVDAKICLAERDSSGHEESFGYNSACCDCAEAINKENEK